jgi:hypothetical protein
MAMGNCPQWEEVIVHASRPSGSHRHWQSYVRVPVCATHYLWLSALSHAQFDFSNTGLFNLDLT